jgi:hypothetical protein
MPKGDYHVHVKVDADKLPTMTSVEIAEEVAKLARRTVMADPQLLPTLRADS